MNSPILAQLPTPQTKPVCPYGQTGSKDRSNGNGRDQHNRTSFRRSSTRHRKRLRHQPRHRHRKRAAVPAHQHRKLHRRTSIQNASSIENATSPGIRNSIPAKKLNATTPEKAAAPSPAFEPSTPCPADPAAAAHQATKPPSPGSDARKRSYRVPRS